MFDQKNEMPTSQYKRKCLECLSLPLLGAHHPESKILQLGYFSIFTASGFFLEFSLLQDFLGLFLEFSLLQDFSRSLICSSNLALIARSLEFQNH